MTYRKRIPGERSGYAAWEAAGLLWLAAADPTCVPRVHEVTADTIVMDRLDRVAPTPAAAEDFGRRLARVHDSGAPAYGSAPDGWIGDGFLGPADQPLPLRLRPEERWGPFWADQRLLATIELGVQRGAFRRGDTTIFAAVAERCRAGEFDDDDPPARIHGDLWSGNVMFTPAGAVMIDPAAHGGHRETDLAMLALFGAPHLEAIIAAYEEVHPLTAGWRERVALHQLHPLLLHAVLFGGGYAGQALAAARHYA